jgi:hypothetical protein
MNNNGIVGMIVVLSAAMLGLTIVNMYGAQYVNANSVEFLWCYSSPISPNNSMCSIDHEECSMLQSADDDAKSDCIKKKNGS